MYHRLRGAARVRALLADRARAPKPLPPAVLFDRDGTLVVDVPYNGDPSLVAPMPGASAALARLRAAGLATAVVSNQSGVALGRLTRAHVDAVNARVDALLGPLGPVLVCEHDAGDGCACRKPAPGLVIAAARELGVAAEDCVVIGDIGADVEAAHAAGASAILVPTARTRAEEIAAAPLVASDLQQAVDARAGRCAMKLLAVRQDSNGDVLLAGPALRALAAHASEVTLVCGPSGRAAAETLPGVDRVICAEASWIEASPAPLRRSDVDAFVDRIAALGADRAFVFTSFHQSPLPAALLLRMAGVPWIAAISEDYPGGLLDLRHRGVPDDLHEVERALSLVHAAGFALPPGDDRRLAMRVAARNPIAHLAPYVVVHPGATVTARAWSPEKNRALVAALAARGERVVVTGGAGERALCAYVAGDAACDLAGTTRFDELARVIAGAEAIVVGNTGAAHVAAAVGTPTVSLFPPTIPAARFRPWRVEHVLLGDQEIACRGCRARICPRGDHACLNVVGVDDVLAALARLRAAQPRAAEPRAVPA